VNDDDARDARDDAAPAATEPAGGPAAEAGPPAGPRSVTAIEIAWRSAWVRAATYVALAAVLVTLAWTLRDRYAFVLQVGVIGFVLAYVLNPLVEALQRIRVRRSIGVALVYVVLLQLFVFGSLLFGQVVVELTRFVNLIPGAVRALGDRLGALGGWFERLVEGLPPSVAAFLDERLGLTPDGDLAAQAQERVAGLLEALVANLLEVLEGFATGGPSMLVSGATSLVSATLQVFLIVLVSAYFLYDFPRFVRNFRAYVPTRWRPLADDLTQKADRAVGGYLRGQILVTILLGILIWIGLSLIGIPLATAISFLAAIFNLVPYLGPIVGTIPAVLLGFTVGPWAPLLAIVVFVVANQIEANVLGPMILSRSVDLHPVTVLLAILAGLGLLGILGALLAVPLVALTKLILEDHLFTRPAYAPAAPASAAPSPSEADPPASGEDA